MKRMILVPEDAYARFEQKQKLETSPIIKNHDKYRHGHDKYSPTHGC